MENDLVDILLTTYNSNIKYLKEQIESLLNQTHKHIKIYISDDASPNTELIDILKKADIKWEFTPDYESDIAKS